MTLELSATSLAAIRTNFRAFDQDLRSDAVRIVDDYFGPDGRIVRRVKELAPVDTGYMRDHTFGRLSEQGFVGTVGWDSRDFEIRVGPTRQSFRAFVTRGKIGSHSFYPVYQEFGTRFHPPHPSLGPAMDELSPDFEREVSAAWDRSVARLSGGA